MVNQEGASHLSTEKKENRKLQFVDEVCPVCGAILIHEKCKMICKSAVCKYRIIYTCSEF